MKKTHRLLYKTSLSFLLTSSVLLILTATLLFVYTSNLLDEEIEEELYTQASFIEQSIKSGNTYIDVKPIFEVKKIDKLRPTVIKDTIIYDPRQDEKELFRELSISTQMTKGTYEIKVRTLVIESKDILVGIIISFTSMLALAFIILFLINKSRNKKLWKPFFNSLEILKNYSLSARETIKFESSNVQEFNDLNLRLNELFLKIKRDYNNLKQFTEDVSHEAQTPLAVIQAKIENIFNQNGITTQQYQDLTSIQKDIKRLSQFNKRLILLAKIDNDQFSKPKSINLQHLIKERLDDFISISENTFRTDIDPKATIQIDLYLAEMLINNLLSNAIKYSKSKSEIHIKANNTRLQVTNTGDILLENPEKVFERFYKEGESKKATGLGLSIVNKICSYYGFKPIYRFQEGEHIFQIDFNVS
jgi:signal transduction histidine kinase